MLEHALLIYSVALNSSIPGLLYLSQSQTNLKQKEKLVFDKLYTGSHTAWCVYNNI